MGKWYGVDFDGSLSKSPGWSPGDPEHLTGEPIPLMVTRVKQWLAEGKEVRIFTARAGRPDPRIIPALEAWCLEHIGQILAITDKKDYDLKEFWDDRAVGLVENTGEIKRGCSCPCWCAVDDAAEDDEELEAEGEE